MPKPEMEEHASAGFAVLRNAGLTKIVSLLDISEALAVGLEQEARYCNQKGLAFLHFPIPDFALPPNKNEFVQLAKSLHKEIRSGEHMAVHCKAGIGRSGMLATSILIADGMQPELAFKTVSEARQISVPDTKEQADFVFSIANHLID